jgi:type IV pilus assembly protein PilY1
VNTFTIDVDEGGNGSIEDDNPRGIKPRQSSFYLAGKYGWFNNTDGSKLNRLDPLATGALGANEQLDGQPFRNILTGALDNTRWEYAGGPNTPDGYVIASQAKKMMEGVSRFFNSIGGSITPSSVMGLSSVNFSTASPDGAMFVPQFDSKTWSGRLLKAKMTFSQSTGDLTIASTLWDAGKILTDGSTATGAVTDPQIKPADRKLFTYSRDSLNQGGQVLTVADKTKLDADVLASLAIKPTGAPAAISDSDMQNATINWLRGDRSLEAGTAGGYLRARTSILGAIVNSGPVYKQGVDSDVTGDGFAQFAATQKTRTATVYVGANDGFLHAFQASDGKELFGLHATCRGRVGPLAGRGGLFLSSLCRRDSAGQRGAAGGWRWEAAVEDASRVRHGRGAQGVFALNVTDPTSFSKDNVLFEFTDRDDPDMGNVVGSPKLVRMKIPGDAGADPTYRWFVAVSSGYNNYKADGYASTDGAQALFC